MGDRRLVLRPSVSFTWPACVLAALGIAVGLWFLVGGIEQHVWQTVLTGVGFVCGSPGSLALWYRNGRLFVDSASVGKTNFLGLSTAVPKAEIADIRTVFAPQPTIALITKDGRVGLKFNRRWWRPEQLQALAEALGVAQTP